MTTQQTAAAEYSNTANYNSDNSTRWAYDIRLMGVQGTEEGAPKQELKSYKTNLSYDGLMTELSEDFLGGEVPEKTSELIRNLHYAKLGKAFGAIQVVRVERRTGERRVWLNA
jgi:hypothetical protein